MVRISTLSHWFDEGVALQHRWMLVVVDNHTFEASPAYFDEDAHDEALAFTRDPGEGQRVDAAYDLTADKLSQLRKRKAWALNPSERGASL